jgi:transcriptional regulator with GAF, ATPase, and Fis domain
MHDQLILLASSDDPRQPSSRHVLDDIDIVRFGRGARGVRRHPEGSQRVLTIRIPDPRVSGSHGCMRRIASGWLLDDPQSRNGVVVNGTPTRHTTIGRGTLLELGHTFFLLHEGPLEEGAPPDLEEADLPAPVPTLATFDGALAERFAALARIAASPDVAVLLLGETGTGKEVVARAVHELSGRRGAFVGVNCGGVPPDLFEAELFGHKKGAFTNAVADRAGHVRSAEGGTLLLDEIGELPLRSQAALLRVIADRSVMPLGNDRAVPVDIRLCSATLRDLSALVEMNTFRRDLFSRLAGFKLRLPPLRERRADFGLLLRARLTEIVGAERVTFTPNALRALFLHGWPLNIRELDSVLKRAVALSADGVIDVRHLELLQSVAPTPQLAADPSSAPPGRPTPGGAPPGAAGSNPAVPLNGAPHTPAPITPAPAATPAPPAPAATPPPPAALPPTPANPGRASRPALSAEDSARRAQLVELLTEHRGNVVVVSRAMGCRRMQVYRWVERYGLDLDSFRR